MAREQGLTKCQISGFWETLADPRRNRRGWHVLDRLDANSSTCLLRHWADQGKRSLFATGNIYVRLPCAAIPTSAHAY